MDTHFLGSLWLIAISFTDRRAASVIEHLQAENRVWRELHGNRRVLLNDRQRRILVLSGKSLGRDLLRQYSGIVTKTFPPRSPNLNAYAERFVRSIKEECLSQMIFAIPKHPQRTIDQYL